MHLQTFLHQLLDKNGANQVVLVRDDASTFEREQPWKESVLPSAHRRKGVRRAVSDSRKTTVLTSGRKGVRRAASDSRTLLVSDVIPPSLPCRRASVDPNLVSCGISRTEADVSEGEKLPPRRPDRKVSIDVLASFEKEWNISSQTTNCKAPPALPSRKISLES